MATVSKSKVKNPAESILTEDPQEEQSKNDQKPRKGILRSIEWPGPLTAARLAACCMATSLIIGGILSLYETFGNFLLSLIF